jgi:CBS domain-containing protein
VFEPPRRLFGGIYVGGAAADHAGQLNLKDALMPIVGFARLYALRHGVDHTNTLDRLDALVERDAVLPASRDDIAAAYDVLMRLRLQRQLATWQAGQPLDNVIQPRQLKHADEALLRQAFSQIAAVQKKIGYDFFGSAGSQANP